MIDPYIVLITEAHINLQWLLGKQFSYGKNTTTIS